MQKSYTDKRTPFLQRLAPSEPSRTKCSVQTRRFKTHIVTTLSITIQKDPDTEAKEGVRKLEKFVRIRGDVDLGNDEGFAYNPADGLPASTRCGHSPFRSRIYESCMLRL